MKLERVSRFLSVVIVILQAAGTEAVIPNGYVWSASGCEGQNCEDKDSSDSTVQKHTEKNHRSSLRHFNHFNKQAEDRKSRSHEAVIPFIGLTDSSRLNKSCCQNGGTCVLGSFCICPKHFVGRSCEYDERIRNCGYIPEGAWVPKNCTWCKCSYGTLHCVRGSQSDCDFQGDLKEDLRHYQLISDGSQLLPIRCLLLPGIFLTTVILGLLPLNVWSDKLETVHGTF